MTKRPVTIWLVRDTCRTEDNPCLNRALDTARQANTDCIALACLEPRRWKHLQFGLLRTGTEWRRLRTRSLLALRADLEQIGMHLWIAMDNPAVVLKRINDEFSISAVVTDLPVAPEEEVENRQLKDLGIDIFTTQTDELFQANDIEPALARLPCSFTQFRKIIEKDKSVIPAYPVTLSVPCSSVAQIWTDPPEVHGSRQHGGKHSAHQHWQQYLQSGALSSYKKTRNALEGLNTSSRLSAWLAHGCLSARQVWHDILEYEDNHGANDSTYWLRFELLWREFFRWYSRQVGSTLFTAAGEGHPVEVTNSQPVFFKNWCMGNTGADIVDAAMRELKTTGWLSNRARQLVASHLIYECGLDWRLGAAWFESQLVDFDVSSNWGNWAYIAGVGADPRGGRIFDLESQADRHDPRREYRERWLGNCRR